MANPRVAQLLAAREEAIRAGDKALGRELYHQAVAMGVDPGDIDSGLAAERANAPVEAAPVVETVEPEPPAEQAVPAKPKRSRKK